MDFEKTWELSSEGDPNEMMLLGASWDIRIQRKSQKITWPLLLRSEAFENLLGLKIKSNPKSLEIPI